MNARTQRGAGAGGPVPGALVRHPGEPGWGTGQVQSAIGNRVTVNFEHAGKRVIDNDIVGLHLVAPERDF